MHCKKCDPAEYADVILDEILDETDKDLISQCAESGSRAWFWNNLTSTIAIERKPDKESITTWIEYAVSLTTVEVTIFELNEVLVVLSGIFYHGESNHICLQWLVTLTGPVDVL